MDVIMYLITSLKDHWILTTILTLTVLLYLHYIANFSGLKKLGLPGPTPWPILGNLVQIMLEKRGMHIYMKHAIEKYGKIFGMYFLKAPSIVIYDPEILKQIFVKDFDKFHDRPKAGFKMDEPLASMMTVLEGQRWKSVRNILTPTFTSGKLKQMINIVHDAADALLGKLEKAADEKKAFNVHEWQQGVTMEVILSTAFGVKTESQTNPDDHLMKLARAAMQRRLVVTLAVMIPVIGQWLSRKLVASRFGFGNSELFDIARGIIKERRQIAPESGYQRKDMLNLMLAAQDPEDKGYKLTENEILAQMVLFILAGYDTSSSVLGLTCYSLAIYPEIQEKVYEEIKGVCSSPDTCTYDEISQSQMPYLDACISETLRMYPPGFIGTRHCNESCSINGVEFKKGMAVIVPIYNLHHDETYFPDPESYMPERFLAGNKESINPFAYLPFGMGPRNCIGMRLALMEMKVVLVRMLQKYRLVRCPETRVPITIKPKAVLSPAEPVMIQVEKRN